MSGDALAGAEQKAKELRATLTKTQETLTHLHEVMLPEAEIPQDLESLVGTIHSSDEVIKGFSYAQTERGVRSFLAVALAHGTKVDFDAITSSFPVGPDEKAMSTKKFLKNVGHLASQFSKLIRACEAEKAKAAAEKSAGAFESGIV